MLQRIGTIGKWKCMEAGCQHEFSSEKPLRCPNPDCRAMAGSHKRPKKGSEITDADGIIPQDALCQRCRARRARPSAIPGVWKVECQECAQKRRETQMRKYWKDRPRREKEKESVPSDPFYAGPDVAGRATSFIDTADAPDPPIGVPEIPEDWGKIRRILGLKSYAK